VTHSKSHSLGGRSFYFLFDSPTLIDAYSAFASQTKV